MAKPRRGTDKTLDGFEGLNELLNPHDLGDLKGNWLVKADNVDIDDGKSVKRRPGTNKVGAFSSPHSLWSDGETAMFVEQGNLRRVDDIDDAALSSTTILSGVGATRMNYAKLHDHILFTNEQKNGMLLPSGSYHEWGVETPAGQPTLSAMTGALSVDHSISVFVTYLDDLGRESGASGIATLQTDSETGVKLTNIPVPSSSSIEDKVIYCTPPDGDVFYMAGIVAPNVTTFNITSFNHLTVQSRTLFLSEPPLGTAITADSGFVWVANGKYLYRSEPLMPHLFKLRENYFEFAGDISIIAAVENGIYVAADETFFIPTTENVPERRTLLPYGAVPGTVIYIPGEKIGDGESRVWAGWLSTKGFILASPDGQVRNVTEANTALVDGIEGGSLVRDDNGYTRVVTTSKQNSESAGLRATDYVDATIKKCPAQSTANTADNYYYTADITTITADAA